MDLPPLRRVERTPEFDGRLEALIPNPVERAFVIESVEWTLARWDGPLGLGRMTYWHPPSGPTGPQLVIGFVVETELATVESADLEA
jgi:hypothetical protein